MSPADERAFGRMEAKLEVILEMLKEGKKDHDKLEARVATVETNINRAAGVVTIITIAFTSVLTYVLKKFGGGT